VVPVVEGRGGSLAGTEPKGEPRPPKEMFLPCWELLAGRGDAPRGEGERTLSLRVEDADRGSAGRPYAGQVLEVLPDRGVSRVWGAAGAGGSGELA
jgi:hypothetical protein